VGDPPFFSGEERLDDFIDDCIDLAFFYRINPFDLFDRSPEAIAEVYSRTVARVEKMQKE
jgi:hypothetical protein